MREARVEGYFKRRVEAAGALVRKFVTPGRRHACDRIVIVPHPERKFGAGRVLFVELKRPGEKPRPGQEREHRRLVNAGATVYVIDTLRGVDDFIEEIARVH